MTETHAASHLVMRSVIDSIEEILGTNGKNSILNYSGFGHLIENPPEYDTEKRMKPEELPKVFIAIREIVGNKGYNSLLRRGGVLSIKNAISKSEPLQALVNLEAEPTEKLNQLYSAYLYNMGLNPDEVMESSPEKCEILIHRRPPYCNECGVVVEDKKILRDITKPGCAFIVGGVKQIGNLRPDLVTVEVEEIKCSLIGDDECLFRINYKIV
jgi:hypothetical protein